MGDEEFSKVVKEALDSLPEEFKKKLDNISLQVEDFPSYFQVEKARTAPGQMLLGLYEGIPQTRRGSYGIGGAIPDRITIFRRSIEYIARDRQEAINLIRDTVIHEIAHHFGMSDEEIDEAVSGK